MKLAVCAAALGLGCAGTSAAPTPAPLPVAAATAPPATSPRGDDALWATLFPMIERMVAPDIGGAPVRIVATAGPVAGWVAAAVSPPYREFPTVVLFRASGDGTWRRVFEGFIPGVQGERTKLLDPHTIGMAFDYTVNEGDGTVPPAAIPKIIELGASNHLSTVVHAYFFHSHKAGPEPYFVDRRATYALAKKLFPGEYDSYPRTECTMFDIPETKRIAMTEGGGGLSLLAETANGQSWTFGWTGVDERGLLVGKTVDAR